ncbi:alcohol oxidase [Exidia glandulosa HHB12029]|uniref:Alcohol oxidase n=1 Tax=Exidia glandulosa HHB12029 TaxID=1314781 RepID=A0A165IRX7_EXIGL|nr:alcohol oxidase [Exidia glandulosa HHB12029]
MPPATRLDNRHIALGAATVALAVVLPYFLRRRTKLKQSPRAGITADPETVAGRVSGSSTTTGIPSFNESLLGYPEYDFVIVGGGTAGCVLAARLTENPSVTVLVLEAGTSGVAQLYSRIPFTFGKLFGTKHDWSIYTQPQPNVDERTLFWPRAKLLGGCSSINALMFHYGNPSDFDEWARISGSEEWSWANLKPYFLKFEKFHESPEFPAVDVSQRGRSGPVQTGYFGNNSDWGKKFVQACLTLGIPGKADFNTDKGTIGTGKVSKPAHIFPLHILKLHAIDHRGQRSSTESAYFTPEVLARPNLHVLTGAHVTKILLAQDHTTGGKRAIGIELASARDGPRYRVRARREVILAAGAVHTPHILMLSGIGPAEHLKAHGVPVLHELPGVGQNLYDHPVVNTHFRADAKTSLAGLDGPGNKPTLAGLKELLRWTLFGTGPLRCNVAESVAFVRSTDPKLFPPGEFSADIEDSTSAEDSPDIELYASPVAFFNHNMSPGPVGPACSFGSILLRPTSTGTVTLQSSDPFTNPIVDPNYLATEHDLAVMKRAVALTFKISHTAPMSALVAKKANSVLPTLDEGLDASVDSEIERLIRKRLETLYHPTSTARMAPLDQGGVVDAQLLVHGIAGLRICDASVFPKINSGHTAAPVIAIAEKTADTIKKAM